MTVASSQKTVTTTATLLTTAPGHGFDGASVLACNRHASASSFIGTTGVTTATGFELKPGESLAVDLEAGEALYGIVASGTGTVHILESSL